MSDFVPRDILPDLWEEILRRHWTFLETEESLQKLEERKKLEGCLKEFLCVVPHDRKFFLPETAHVLRKSIHEMDEFTANKAILGFDAISQYANNLFTKPWRKEYRVLKMYSGFYQHEVKSNLLDAEKLFEAMGYRQMSKEVLILEGPICPDQVTNVSRDAMAAYVECQIIKHIYSGLVAMGLTCSWQDVFHYREKHSGGSSQAIKGMAYEMQQRNFPKEKQISSDNCYATIQHAGNIPQVPLSSSAGTPMVQQCPNCVALHMAQTHHQQQSHMTSGQCAVHSNNNNNSCALHPQQSTNLMFNNASGNSKMLGSYPAGNYQQHAFVAPGMQHHYMPHSRSLDQYNEPPPPLSHRHSFDHQQQGCMAHHPHHPPHLYHYPTSQHVYESPYDCIDGVSMGESSATYGTVGEAGASNCNYNAAYMHPYNVSGNRYPLPLNISNQLNSHYATPVTSMNCNGGVKSDHYIDSYANIAIDGKHNCNYHAGQLQQQRSPLPPARHHFTGSKDFQAYRQRSFPPDQHLIDFDDRAPLTDHDYHAQLHTRSQNNSFDYGHERMYDMRATDRRVAALAAGVDRMNINSMYAQPKDAVKHQLPSPQHMYPGDMPSSDDVDGNYVYARPRPKGNNAGVLGQQRGERYALEVNMAKTTDKYVKNSDLIQDHVDNNGKMQKELNESATDLTANGMSNGRRKCNSVVNDCDTSDVSYESAPFDDFVNVGNSEHAAAVSLTQRSPTQASKNQDGVGSFESWNYVFQNLERSGYSKDLGERGDLLVQSLDLDSLPTGSASNTNEKRRSSHVAEAKSAHQINGEKSRTLEKTPSSGEKRETRLEGNQEKSILKPSNSNSTNTGGIAGTTKMKSALKSSIATPIQIAVSSHNNNNDNPKSKTKQTKTQNANRVQKQSSPASTQDIVTHPKQWSCRFCTFLNPETKRICEMCCRSHDFNLGYKVPNKAPCF